MCLTKYPLDIASDQLRSAMAYIAAIRALCISYLGSLEMRWSFANLTSPFCYFLLLNFSWLRIASKGLILVKN